MTAGVGVICVMRITFMCDCASSGYTGTVGWFNTTGSSDPTLYPGSIAVTGNLNGDPRGAGYIFNVSYWPWQNLQLAAQYTAYTRFNGGSTDYDGLGRNASGNNTIYLDAKIVF